MVEETDTMVTLPIAGDLTFREWHHFINGVSDGYRDDENRPEEQVAYWDAGFIVGNLVLRRFRNS